MSERSPKRSRMERRMEMLITATTIMSPDEAIAEMTQLKNKINQLHHTRSKLYSFMYDSMTQNMIVKLSNGKITNSDMKELRDNFQEELTDLRNRIIEAEIKLNNLKAFFKNE